MHGVPETRYAKSGESRIACRTALVGVSEGGPTSDLFAAVAG